MTRYGHLSLVDIPFHRLPKKLPYVAQNSSTTTLVRPSGIGPPTVVEASPLMTKKSSTNGTTVPTDIAIRLEEQRRCGKEESELFCKSAVVRREHPNNFSRSCCTHATNTIDRTSLLLTFIRLCHSPGFALLTQTDPFTSSHFVCNAFFH